MTLSLKMKTNYLNIFYLIFSILLQCTYCTIITPLNEINNLTTTITTPSLSSSSSSSSSTLATTNKPEQTYHFKYSIDELLNSKFEKKISNDIDYDPCKSGGFMGDIALPNINYESEWQTQKLNKSFQQELERMKQEVYHEGLQVEEEGLTDIIRKKTKLPNINQNGEDNLSNERHKNDPAIILENSVRQSTITTSPTTTTSSATIQIPISSNDTQLYGEPNDNNKLKENVKNQTNPFRHNIDEKKIQSDTKDIIDDSGDHIIALRKPIIVSTTTTTTTTTILPPIIQPTQSVNSPDDSSIINSSSSSNRNGISNRNRFNDGTTVVQVINSENTYNRKRHRRRRQGRNNKGSTIISRDLDALKNTNEYQQRFKRLKYELNRPVLTVDELHSKSTNARRHQHQHNDKYLHNHNMQHNLHQKHTITNSDSNLKIVKPLVFEEQEQSLWLNDMPMVQQQEPQGQEGEEAAVKEEVTTYKVMNKKKPIITDVDPPMEDDDLTTVMPLMEKNDNDNRLKELQHHHRITRAATAKKERIWDYGVIPYEIDGNFSGAHKALFKQAMRHWENSTCIKFVERDPDHHPNFIIFTTRPCGCCSFVGKRGNGGQAISIGKNCDKFGIVVHELGHVVGFWHEHTRPDRENHVVIDKHNIIIGQEYNFNKLTSEDVDSLGLPYDYDSIMHYAKNTFSRGTYLDTILPVEVEGFKRPEIGQRIKLSDGDISQASLLYKCPKCGRTFQDTSGQFSSPNYNLNSQNMADSMQCEWRITATHGEKIILNITDLDIYKSANCTTDYLEIRDGYWHKSQILVRYCGSGKISDIIQSTGSRMLLTYTSTNANTYRGFSASYEAICGGDLHIDNSSVHLESPNYPLDYLQNKECIWKITVPEEFQVALRFQSFEVENHDNCIYDYVEVRDGDKANSTLIGIFCGFKIPPDMRSTSNKMYVKFFSDGSVQKAGFSAIFIKELDECELNNHGCEHECINTLGGYQCSCNIGYELNDDEKSCQIDTCGGMIRAPSGVITSPSFPNLYPIDKNCVWEIIAPVNFRILLNFTHFDLEGNHLHQLECEYDSISVYSKLYQDNLKRHGVFCGTTMPEAIASESNELRIEFKSDKNIQKSGFAAVFTTDIDECATNNGGCMHECKNTMGAYYCTCHNGYVLHENKLDCKEGGCKYEITAPQGQIYSPNYPEYYPPGKDCVWHFSTTPGHRIRLTFTFFEMEPHQECAYDHIAIYNGNSEDGLALGRFCGSKLPYAISAYSNEMYMIFKSDVSVQRKGFAANHFTACGGRLKATNKLKHFYSHARFGDSIYDSNSECDWVIEADPGRNVQLMFLSFTIEDEQNCSYDYVDIFGGLDDFSGPLYGRYCGHNKPPEIISLHEALLVRFVTDATMAFKGFSASYVALDPFDDTEEMSSDSSEMSTPFPGYFKNIYVINGEDEDEDEYHDYDYPNKIKQTKINSDNTLFY